MISVIIATKDGEKYLPRSISSIERQTEQDLEIIVVSDGSTDSTPDVVREMQVSRPWLKLIELSTNIGQGKARDRGIKEAQGEYIALLDDDDEWLDTDKLRTQTEFLDHHTDYVLVGARTILEVQEGTSKQREYVCPETDSGIRQQFLLRNCFVTSTVVFKKDAYLSSGGFRSLEPAEDYDLYLRLGRLGKLANLEGCLIRYVVRPQGSSKMRARALYTNIIKIVKDNKKYYPHYYLGLTKAYLRLVYFSIFRKHY